MSPNTRAACRCRLVQQCRSGVVRGMEAGKPDCGRVGLASGQCPVPQHWREVSPRRSTGKMPVPSDNSPPRQCVGQKWNHLAQHRRPGVREVACLAGTGGESIGPGRSCQHPVNRDAHLRASSWEPIVPVCRSRFIRRGCRVVGPCEDALQLPRRLAESVPPGDQGKGKRIRERLAKRIERGPNWRSLTAHARR